MKRKFLSGLFFLGISLQLAAQYQVSGTVETANGAPLQGATIYIEDIHRGTVSDSRGYFSLEDLPAGDCILMVSFIGYQRGTREINPEIDRDLGRIVLERAYFMGDEATINALRAVEKTPMAFVNMTREEIAARNYGQDIPFILASTPSVITSSDAGHGIGYTSMRIRGTDANRINVTINGIPLNDAESQSVFWVDLPELASSTRAIQVQRGVGTSTNGAAAFGATVNLLTTASEPEPYAMYSATAGSFNTIRNTVSVGTGLINDRFTLDMRLSDLHSDGYIRRSWTDLQSYYLAAGWQGKTSAVRFITFGGFEELYQSWGGVPSFLLKTDRTYNGMGEYADSSGTVKYYDRQVDHYDQVHYQLHFTKQFSERFSANAALHYTWGRGYYEEYESGQEYAYYNMEPPVIGTDTLFTTDLVRRKWLDNDFYGTIVSLKYSGEKGTLLLGGGWNRYVGLHFGRVIWAEVFGGNSIGHKWYEGTGDKTDWNIYSKYYHDLSNELTMFADLQVRAVAHRIEGADANNRDVTQNHRYLFFNPKAGLNYAPSNGKRAFISFSRASREPNRNNYTDAPDGQPPLKETLNDFEAGISLKNKELNASLTLYFMDYRDQLVLTGEINEVGYPVMTNVPESYRAGAELEAGFNFQDKIRWNGNMTLSRNVIKDFVNYIDNWDYWGDPDNQPYQVEERLEISTLAYSPSIIASSRLDYTVIDRMIVSIVSRYVGSQFIDNSSDTRYMIEPYFVNDLNFSYSPGQEWTENITLSLMVCNLLNTSYETNAWLYRFYSEGKEMHMDGYFPQAGRHIMVGLNIMF